MDTFNEIHINSTKQENINLIPNVNSFYAGKFIS